MKIRSKVIVIIVLNILSLKSFNQTYHICEKDKKIMLFDSLVYNKPKKALHQIQANIKNTNKTNAYCDLYLLKYYEVMCYINLAMYDTAALLFKNLNTFFDFNKMQHKTYVQYKNNLLHGYLSIRSGDLEAANKIFDELINNKSITNDDNNLFTAYLYKLIAVQNMQLKDSAMSLLNYVENKFNQQKAFLKDFYRLSIIRGYLYRDAEKYNQAIEIIIPIINEIKQKNKLLFANVCLLLSQAYFEIKSYNNSRKYTELGLEALDSLQTNHQRSIFYIRNSFIDTVENNYKAAYHNVAKAYDTNQKIYNDKIASITIDNLVRYKTELKEIENKTIKSKQQFLIILSTIAILLLTYFFYLNQKLKTLTQKQKENNEFQNVLIKIISHDFKSPLNALNNIIDQILFYLNKKDLEKLQLLSTGINESAINMLNLLNNLLGWVNAKNNIQATDTNIYNAIDNTIKLYAGLIVDKKVTIENNVDINLQIKLKKNILDIIIRNWLDNVLKHSNCSKIRIDITKQPNNFYQLIISHNSMMQKDLLNIIQHQIENKKIIETENNIGLGLYLIGNFSSNEGWKIDINTNNNETNFVINISSQE